MCRTLLAGTQFFVPGLIFFGKHSFFPGTPGDCRMRRCRDDLGRRRMAVDVSWLWIKSGSKVDGWFFLERESR